MNIFLKILFFVVFLLFSLGAKAQKEDSSITLYGKLYDSKDYSPVEFAHIINLDSPYATISDSSGFFDIKLQVGDTLHITSIGYHDESVAINKSLPAIFRSIPMQKRTYDIKSVEVTPWGTYQDFKYDFITLDIDDPEEDVHPLLWRDLPGKPIDPEPHYPDVFNPVSFLYDVFSGNRKERMKYNEILSKETKKQKIRSKYNKEIVGNLTGLEGEELGKFMEFCNFSDKELLNKTGYEILKKVKQKYQIFKQDTATN
ncbi:MAG: hypothetical protein ACQESJ_02080 [Bacteroidota bacterium]